jgi:glycosyltransferase involved in cell wall biosynthesis
MSARYLAQSYQTLTEATPAPYQATVVIPTFNGGPLLQEVVASALQQELAAGFELLIIDSESNDGSIDSLPNAANLSVYRIVQKEFQHGRTRNLAIALAKAPLVAFITQDAIPANEHWLRNLINPLLQSEDVAGVFGRHLAHQDHPGYLSLWMNSHFAAFEAEGIYRKSDNLERYYAESPSWRQFLHYYSDNNSCMRKSVWEESPYPDLDYGEDQLWADWIIQTGKTKAYADDAIVFHSHHYTCNEEYKRSRTEALFFMKYFGYELAQNRFDLETGLENEAKRLLNIAEPEIQESQQHLLLLLRAKREGYRAGCRDYRQWLMQEEVT